MAAWIAIVVGVTLTLVMTSLSVGPAAPPSLPGASPPAGAELPPGTGAADVGLLEVLAVLLGLALGAAICFRAVRRLVQRQWISRLDAPAPWHGYYVEAFALWLVLGIPASILAFAFHGWTGLPAAVEDAIIHPFGLIVLMWPFIRGVPLAVILEDVGLHRGDGPLREAFAGLIGYLAKWPVFLSGVLLATLLARWAGAASLSAHPVVQVWTGASSDTRSAIAVMAVVLAPVLEEVLFRGLLLRHLRSLQGPLGAAAGPAGAALISASVFALVHPQGALAAPVLAAEGFALGLIRDWRGSLIAPITAHAAHNAVLMWALGS